MGLTNKGVGIGLPAPDFELTATDGKSYSLSSFRGRPLIVFFMRRKLGFNSRSQLEQLKSLHEIIDSIAQLIVILEDDGEPDVSGAPHRYIDSSALPCPVLNDPRGKVLNRYNIYKLVGLDGFQMARPSLFMIGYEQEIVYNYVGEKPLDYPNYEILMAQLQNIVVANSSRSNHFLPVIASPLPHNTYAVA